MKESDKLPEKCRGAAEKALENARKTSKRGKLDGEIDITWRRQPDWRGYFDRLNPRNYAPGPFDRGDEMFGRIQEQMREMRKRLDVLEKRFWERLDGFLDERDEKEPLGEEESAPSKSEGMQKV